MNPANDIAWIDGLPKEPPKTREQKLEALVRQAYVYEDWDGVPACLMHDKPFDAPHCKTCSVAQAIEFTGFCTSCHKPWKNTVKDSNATVCFDCSGFPA